MSAERYVRRVPRHVIRPGAVGNTDPPARGLPSGAGAAPSPAARREFELNSPCHLEWGRYSNF